MTQQLRFLILTTYVLYRSENPHNLAGTTWYTSHYIFPGAVDTIEALGNHTLRFLHIGTTSSWNMVSSRIVSSQKANKSAWLFSRAMALAVVADGGTHMTIDKHICAHTTINYYNESVGASAAIIIHIRVYHRHSNGCTRRFGQEIVYCTSNVVLLDRSPCDRLSPCGNIEHCSALSCGRQ